MSVPRKLRQPREHQFTTHIVLTPEAYEDFRNAIENPRPPNAALLALFRRERNHGE